MSPSLTDLCARLFCANLDLAFSRNRYRSVCQSAILLDFDTARETDVEGRLWDAHLKLNIRFRKQLSRVSTDRSCRAFVPL